MRTKIYEQTLQEILLYCSYASNCIILAETNDMNTKDELIQDISMQFSVEVYSLSAFAEVSKDLFITKAMYNKIIIIDEILSGSSESIVGNLNYNRDWLLNLNAKIIMILPTAIIDRIRRSTYNFWSCVSLQRSFDSEKPYIMSPIFIDNDALKMESEADVNRRKSINKKLYKSQQSVRGIIAKTFDIPVHEVGVGELRKLLEKHISQINSAETREVIGFYDFAFDLGQEFYFHGHYRYALECFQFIEKKLHFGYDFRSLQFKLQEAIAQTYYKNCRYKDATNKYAMLIESYNRNTKLDTDKSWNNEMISRICNNFATTNYFLKNYDDSFLWFQFAIDFSEKASGYLHYSQTLYNLALLSCICKKDSEALEFIDAAIETIKSISSRHYNIITANYQVLRAYILLNRGNFLEAEQQVKMSLSLLREELYESSFYILVAHFVYASVYLRTKRWDAALHCVNKAEKISRDVKCSPAVKAQLYELMGEIHYNLGNSYQTKQNLNMALFWNKRSQVFPPEIEKWISDQVS